MADVSVIKGNIYSNESGIFSLSNWEFSCVTTCTNVTQIDLLELFEKHS
jgi:hypothetical protein